mgnify:CR=1 FL=1
MLKKYPYAHAPRWWRSREPRGRKIEAHASGAITATTTAMRLDCVPHAHQMADRPSASAKSAKKKSGRLAAFWFVIRFKKKSGIFYSVASNFPTAFSAVIASEIAARYPARYSPRSIASTVSLCAFSIRSNSASSIVIILAPPFFRLAVRELFHLRALH